MEHENILAVNLPNMISITIMAVVGGLILGSLRKLVKNRNSKMAAN